MTTLEIIDHIHKLIFEDYQFTAKSIAEQVESIIYEDLDIRKHSAKWVPKCVNEVQKRQQCQLSEQLLEFFWCYPNEFLS